MRAALLAFVLLDPQGAPAGASLDRTPSEPAAAGFLATVDQRVYSLEAAGAVAMRATIHATLEILDKDEKLKPATLDVAVAYDYATGTPTRQIARKPSDDEKLAQQMAFIAADNAFLTKPSRAAIDWRVTFAEEKGAQAPGPYRLDFHPRQQPSLVIDHYTEWYRADGTPLHRQTVSNRPNNGALELITQEVVPTYVEKKGKLLLTELAPVAADGALRYTFEYAEQDGFFILKRLVQENTGSRLTLEFTTIVTKPPAKKPAGAPDAKNGGSKE